MDFEVDGTFDHIEYLIDKLARVVISESNLHMYYLSKSYLVCNLWVV